MATAERVLQILKELVRDLLPYVRAITVTALYGPVMLSAAFPKIPM